jgi:hypothetical protein
LAEAHPEVSSSVRLRREVCRDGSSVRRQREVLRSALPSAQAMHPASPAHGWRQPEAARRAAAARPEVSALRHLQREVKAAWSV